jgi:hypothetical protein
MSVHHGEQELRWGFVAGLLGIVLLSIAAMIGAGFALAWFAEKVA